MSPATAPTTPAGASIVEQDDLTDAQRLVLARAAFEHFNGHGWLDSADGTTYLLIAADAYDALSEALYGPSDDGDDEEIDWDDESDYDR